MERGDSKIIWQVTCDYCACVPCLTWKQGEFESKNTSPVDYWVFEHLDFP
jgi:hypothetical protein